jgi:predicted cupin superfamily sugar epimerase
MYVDGEHIVTVRLGSDLISGERPQAFIPAGAWQSARTLGPWTLAGCTVAPGFQFDRFEMAPPGWQPLERI